MKSTDPTSGMHLRSLTGLRFYAAIAVVLYHLHLYFPPLGHSLDAAGYGFTGVSFFFVLSGFVLAWSYRDGDKARQFYRNRFARVWPLHALTMFMAIFAPPLSTPTTVWPAAPFVLTLTQSWLPGSDYLNAFNGVSWSLSCEAFFYLLFPFLVGLLSRIARLTRFSAGLYFTMSALAMAAFLSIPIPVANYLLGTTPLYRLGEFVLGVSLALLIKRGWRPRFGLLQAVILSATLYGSLFVISSTTVGDPGSLPVAWANLIMMPGFLAIIAATSASDLNENNAILGSRPMVRLGQWSFALYLVHELVIRCMRPLVVGLNVGAAVVASAVVIAIALALSGVLHEFVERPVEKLLRSSRVRSKPSTAPVPEETSR